MFLYNLVDKFLMRDFTELIIKNLKTKNQLYLMLGVILEIFQQIYKKG